MIHAPSSPILIVACLWAVGRLYSIDLPAAPLQLKPGVPVVVAASEPPQIRRAAQDLCRDLAWVLNAASPLLERIPEGAAQSIVISSGATDMDVTGHEAHSITVRDNQVLLQGSDMRGAIYAIYSFSERFLDMPPWWFWADWKPRSADFIEIPRDSSMSWKSPQVKWRGWFPNDTDLLSPWIQRDYNAHWDRVLETMLRLKLNLLDVGEFSADSLRKLRLPRDRGLAVTTTHLAPFGASLRDWAKYWKKHGKATPPPLLLADMASLDQFWEHHIRLATNEGVEMLWMVGLRGDGDKGFYKTFGDAPSDDASRAKVIEKALHHQVALLQRVTGQDQPPMRTVIYDEASDYMAAGLLHPPELPNLIWNFSAARHDHYPPPDLRNYRAPAERPLGYYFNVQFTYTGSHLADGEGPWKMEKNHRILLQSGPNLQLSIVNCGNIREFPLSLAAHAQMMWDFGTYDSDRYLNNFCHLYWGKGHAAEVAALYRLFFNAYWRQRKPDINNFERQYIFHDLRVARAARDLMRATMHETAGDSLLGDRGIGYYRIVPEDGGTSSKMDAVLNGNQQAARDFEEVARLCNKLAPLLAEQGVRFFDHSLRMQARFMAAASACTAACAGAYKERHRDAEYAGLMNHAKLEAETMDAILKSADESGAFAGWYESEKIFGLKETREMIERRTSKNAAGSKAR